MKTDFNVHVSVELGVTPELVKLVTAIMGGRDTDEMRQPRTAATNAPRKGEAPGMSAPGTRNEAAKDGRGGDAESAMNGGETDEAAMIGRGGDTESAMNGGETDEAAMIGSDAEDKPKELTEEDIRMAMHKTRQRIEGENYKEETDGEGYQKYHRKLTAEFKRIAAALGSDKPSALPAEQRAAFIKACEGLIVTDEGTIEEKLPF